MLTLNSIQSLEALDATEAVSIKGNIIEVKELTTMRGDLMAMVSVSDGTAEVRVVVFPDSFQQYKGLLSVGSLVRLAGRVNKEDEGPVFIAEEIVKP